MSKSKLLDQVTQLVDQFILYLRIEKNGSQHTICNYHRDIFQFVEFASSQAAADTVLINVTPLLIRSYLAFLKSEQYAKATIMRRIAALRSFFRFLCRENIVDQNPFAAVKISGLGKRVTVFLDVAEVDELIALPDQSPLGIRDKAVLELLYATGVGVSELTGITLPDIDFSGRTIIVSGKGVKQRIVLMGRRAVQTLENYLLDSRPVLCVRHGEPVPQMGKAHDRLFVNSQGGPLSDRSVRRIVKKYAEALSLPKNVSPHTIRHSFASHLLDNGADFKSVQELLGHANMASIQLDTQIPTERLRANYKKYHPRS